MPEALDKPALRRHYQALRDAAPALDRAAWSAEICRHLAAHCDAHGIHQLAVFWPIGSEIDLRPLIDAHPFWTFHFPKVFSKDPPVLAWGMRPLAAGAWGLQEPLEATLAIPPAQLVLVPGLAFAADGHRLGYGKGFYDAMLAALPAGVATLGVGFSFQRCAALPFHEGDRPVDGWVDEHGLTWR